MKNEKTKPTWGGSRPGSGRKKEKVRIDERAYVLPETAKIIKRLKRKEKKTYGELLDERFNSKP